MYFLSKIWPRSLAHSQFFTCDTLPKVVEFSAKIPKNILFNRGAKVPELINEEVGINVEGGIFWKNLVHKCNKRGVEGGKNLRNQ